MSAKKTSEATRKLDLKNAVESISMQAEIDKQAVLETLEKVIIFEFAEFFNVMDDDFEIEIDEEFGVSLFLIKEVVGEVFLDSTEISIDNARTYQEDAEEGDFVRIPVDFGILDRRTIKHLNRSLNDNLRRLRNEALYNEFKEKEGTILSGTVLRRSRRDIFIDVGKTEVRLPWREQSPRESFKQGDRIRIYFKEAHLDEESKLSFIVSRVDPDFIRALFAIEVPEIADGTVEIRDIVREPGSKVKMSVAALKAGVEPVGACVGLSGIRIKAVINELGGEKIDVIPVGSGIKELIGRSMQPAKVKKVLVVNDEEKEALVVVDDESLPLAIGKGGTNIKLASRLTGWRINLKTESQIAKHPEIMEILSKADDIFNFAVESDLHQLTELDEELIVKLMNGNVLTVSELYEKNVNEIATIEGITLEDARRIRKVLDEMVEVVDDDGSVSQSSGVDYQNEFEDEIEGVNTDEELQEEIEQVEYLVCPSCGFEFEYTNQEKCPSCNVEFEFDEEEIIEE